MSSRKVCFPFLILKNFDCFAFENTFDNIKPQILITCSTRAKKKNVSDLFGFGKNQKRSGSNEYPLYPETEPFVLPL